jgi:hypothetical protein
MVAISPCHIHLPKRFVNCGLASIDDEIFIHGTYALIVEECYAVSNVTAMVNICPTRILDLVIDEVDYYDFWFEPGDKVIGNLNVIKRDSLIFTLLEELIIKANIPWYMSYDDLGKLFDLAKDYAASNVGELSEIIEFIVSLVSRKPNDRIHYYRTLKPELMKEKSILPEYIPLTNVFYAATNTVNKLAGNYFNNGIISSLITKTNQIEHLESLLTA